MTVHRVSRGARSTIPAKGAPLSVPSFFFGRCQREEKGAGRGIEATAAGAGTADIHRALGRPQHLPRLHLAVFIHPVARLALTIKAILRGFTVLLHHVTCAALALDVSCSAVD